MNGRKAKAVRKLVYNGVATNPRYVRVKSDVVGRTNPILNVGDMEKVTDSSTGNSREIPRRRIYRHLKKIAKGIPINQLKRVFLNENSQSVDSVRPSRTN